MRKALGLRPSNTKIAELIEKLSHEAADGQFNQRDERGWTPVFYACHNSHSRCVEVFKNLSPRYLCVKEECMQPLDGGRWKPCSPGGPGGSCNCKGKHFVGSLENPGETLYKNLAQIAATAGANACLEILLDQGLAELKAPVASREHGDHTKFELNHIISTPSEHKRTPAHSAAKMGSCGCVQLLGNREFTKTQLTSWLACTSRSV